MRPRDRVYVAGGFGYGTVATSESVEEVPRGHVTVRLDVDGLLHTFHVDLVSPIGVNL